VLEFIRPYIPELVGWFRDFGVGAANYDANGHYARVQPMFLPANYAGGTLTAATPAQKFNGFETNVKNRCPGGVTQSSADGSSPFAFGGCDTGASP
jgi:phospholipid/cholesterol/gamma-HCH transport system substrate-binding protein